MTKKVDTWMPLLVDKYLGDTTHLSTEQHGAYLLLLLTMWKRDGSLPNKDAQLAAIARMSPARWKASKEVLMEFFTVNGESITQKRLTQELAHSKKITDVKSKAGTEGARRRWLTDSTSDGKTIADAMANVTADESHSAYHPDASISIPSSSSKKNTPLPPEGGRRRPKNFHAAEGFAEFYARYPRKVAKAHAEKVWAKLHPDDELQNRIMSALEHNGFDYRENGRFIPHPATWLNEGRWDDEPTLLLDEVAEQVNRV